MWYETSFLGNPYTNEHYSRERKLLFAFDQVARLRVLDANAFGARIADTEKAANNLSTAIGSTGAATSTQRGATLGTDSQLQELRREISSVYSILLGRFKQNKNAPLLITVFGPKIQKYTRDLLKTNAKERMDGLDKLLDAHSQEIGPDLVANITDAADLYLSQRDVQAANKATTNASQLAAGTQELALNQALWLNLGAVVAQYPAPEQERQRHATADFSLLLRRAVGPAPHTEAGPLAAHTLENLVDSGLLPTTKLHLHNPGAVPLRFGLSPDLFTFPATGYQEVAPGATLDLTAADLGDPATLPYLQVQNATDLAGAYEVRVG